MGSPKGQRAELSDISIYRNAANMLVDASKEAHTPGAVKNWRDAMKANKKQTAVTRPDPAAMGAIQTLIDLGVIKNLWDPLPTLKDVAQKMGAERRDYRNLIKNPSIRVFPELVQWRATLGAMFGHFDETERGGCGPQGAVLSGIRQRYGGTGRGAFALSICAAWVPRLPVICFGPERVVCYDPLFPKILERRRWELERKRNERTQRAG
jgi:hypothetical protein